MSPEILISGMGMLACAICGYLAGVIAGYGYARYEQRVVRGRVRPNLPKIHLQ